MNVCERVSMLDGLAGFFIGGGYLRLNHTSSDAFSFQTDSTDDPGLVCICHGKATNMFNCRTFIRYVDRV